MCVCVCVCVNWSCGETVCKWPGRLGFNSRSSHNSDSKNLGVAAYEKGAFSSSSTIVADFSLFYLYIYAYIFLRCLFCFLCFVVCHLSWVF